jgi:hypothetical protein
MIKAEFTFMFFLKGRYGWLGRGTTELLVCQKRIKKALFICPFLTPLFAGRSF